ncbi:TPA: transposase family protein [Legionella pneumophila]|nr:transposase family protein [Legionella pneumophila]HBD7394409.1 transposase family protein [Legionella pneumophila]HBD7423042.1 transposase family protein [Legionella pneumophila]HBD9326958.1 transposase family protein [Legionella pneumophila]HEM6992194.1 transposase family protein [Legionella pneumophila]
MGKLSMELYLKNLSKRYRAAGRREKGLILQELCDSSGYHKKHAIRLLNKNPKRMQCKIKTGRPNVYPEDVYLEPLKRIWLLSDQPCGKRLKMILPLWLPFYGEDYGVLEPAIYDGLLSMSAATIDRLLVPLRVKYKRSFGGTKPGNILKKHIPVKTNQWDENQPGYLEADTVAHCGSSLSGNFVWSLTMTDICSGWTELRAVWNKGATGVVSQIEDIEHCLPFLILGFDCDNGSEFLNWHLMHYFSNEEGAHRIHFTRSRPYHSDDNAHVEQKNWTHVRQLFGYARFDNEALVELMNDLYKNEVSQMNNFFLPNFKLIQKQRIQAKIIKKHSKPETPYQRLMKSDFIDEEKKKELTEIYNLLNPFKLQKTIQKKLKRIFAMVNIKTDSKMRYI